MCFCFSRKCGGESARWRFAQMWQGTESSPHKRPPPKMRRKGEVDGMAGVTAFFHRGLCPLCGGGFQSDSGETLLFTPTEERRQMPSGLPPLRLWRGKDCKKGTPVNPGCFCFSRECGRKSACVGAVLGKRGSGIVIRLTGDSRELLPAGAVQPVPCRLSKIRAAVRHTETFRFSLFTLH